MNLQARKTTIGRLSPAHCGWLGLLATLLFSLQLAAAQSRAGTGVSAARLIDTLAANHDARVVATLQRIHGTDRRLLALRSYLRAGEGLAARWSWTAAQIEAFTQSEANAELQREIEQVRAAFSAANPGYELWVNPEVRSLDVQLANWNGNTSVGQAAARLLADFQRWLATDGSRSLSSSQQRQAAREFLAAYLPTPVPTLAAPGLSPHGQMRAVDFQILQEDRIVAGPDSRTIGAVWDAAGWAEKLATAVRAGSQRFTGPLESPREPWHYTFNPEKAEPAP